MRTASQKSPAEWLSNRERGSNALLRLMAALSLRVGRHTSRIILYAITAYFFLFAPRARRASRRYLRLALGREPGPGDRFRHLLYFATAIHDRVFLLNGRERAFSLSIAGEELMRAQLAAGRGAILIGAHIGSFEVVGAIGRRNPGLRVAMAMYEENAQKIHAVMSAINPTAVTDVVPLGRMDSMLQIAGRIEAGAFVGILADRTLAEEPLQAVVLLGERAYLPTGPMRIAAMLGCPVIFMAGLYRGANRYHVVFAQVADFVGLRGSERTAAVADAVNRYALLIERCCRDDPYNWFNFFDFWRPTQTGGSP